MTKIVIELYLQTLLCLATIEIDEHFHKNIKRHSFLCIYQKWLVELISKINETYEAL